MTDYVEISFIFHHQEYLPIDGDWLQQIRRCVADVMQMSGWGRVIPNADATFMNVNAIPITDTYDEREGHNTLLIQYVFQRPLAHGDLASLVTYGVTDIENFLQNQQLEDITYNFHLSFN